MMRVFSDFSPDVEALSLDEAFLDMTGSAPRYRSQPERVAWPSLVTSRPEGEASVLAGQLALVDV
jgi:nucleotidyltransferase/DNA polymerase involved in DNA repair